ncbi:SDR family NAD(P)-dependent oxidoreductase [Novosphingobium sp.]|uniref:SDR family NAD(P)-dependent oxidoreductase n=1 Tax=Novosphingobium sp. TaxID=1874826 RepID=UPI003563E7F4
MTSGILRDKTVVVTGAASGIGRGIALAAQGHGAKAIVLADLVDAPREGGETTESLLSKTGIPHLFKRADVTSVDDMEALIAASEAFGGVDVMVCNAGIALPNDTIDLNPEDLRRLLSINVEGAFYGAQAAARQMQRMGKKGSIVFISSMGGLRGASFTVGYSTSKGGVNLMVCSLADALGPQGIRVNAVCPGLIDTALVQSSPDVAAAFEPLRQRMPLRRFGNVREVGDVVAWLGSDLSSFVTGVALPVDGGQTATI